MVLIKGATVFRSSQFNHLGLLARLILSSVVWSLCQGQMLAQFNSPSNSTETVSPVEVPVVVEEDGTPLNNSSRPELPSVERLESRPTLEDLDPRVRTESTPDFIQSTFEQYRLGPGDGIFVSVQRFPDLSFQATLDQQGNVILPIEGAVPLKGLTLNEAENRIRAVYNQYVVLAEVRSIGLANALQGLPYQVAEVELNQRIVPDYQTLRTNNPQQFRVPDVTLTLTAQRGVEVIILGEIGRPGLYPLQAPRVTTALLAAGGAMSTADLREIRIQRRLPDNRVIEKTVDLYTPIRDGVPLPEERLEDGDIVIISRLDPAQAQDYDVNLVTRSTLAQPEILVRVLSNPGGSAAGRRLPNGSTFVDALLSSNLPLNQAKLRSVALVRFDPEQGKPVVTKFNAKEAILGDPTQNPPLRNNDVIVIGRNFVNRLTFAIDTITRPFQDILSFFIFFEGIFDGDFFD